MKTLSEMTTGELKSLKDTLDGLIRDGMRTGRPVEPMVRFQAAVDDELWSRGA